MPTPRYLYAYRYLYADAYTKIPICLYLPRCRCLHLDTYMPIDTQIPTLIHLKMPMPTPRYLYAYSHPCVRLRCWTCQRRRLLQTWDPAVWHACYKLLGTLCGTFLTRCGNRSPMLSLRQSRTEQNAHFVCTLLLEFSKHIMEIENSSQDTV